MRTRGGHGTGVDSGRILRFSFGSEDGVTNLPKSGPGVKRNFWFAKLPTSRQWCRDSSQEHASNRVTVFGDSDSTRVTLRNMVTRLESPFSQNDSTRVKVNDSRLESESFLQNLWVPDGQTRGVQEPEWTLAGVLTNFENRSRAIVNFLKKGRQGRIQGGGRLGRSPPPKTCESTFFSPWFWTIWASAFAIKSHIAIQFFVTAVLWSILHLSYSCEPVIGLTAKYHRSAPPPYTYWQDLPLKTGVRVEPETFFEYEVSLLIFDYYYCRLSL